MGTQVTRYCDVCKDQAQQDLLGLYWASKGWEHRYVKDCNNHVCTRCAEQISVIWETHKQMSTESEGE